LDALGHASIDTKEASRHGEREKVWAVAAKIG